MTQEPQQPSQPRPVESPAGAAPDGAAPDVTGPTATTPLPRRPLARSGVHRVIAGVCGGIGSYLEVDPVLVRVAFVMLALFTQGFGLLAYVVLWVVMPEDGSEPAEPASGGSRSSSRPGGGGLVLGVVLMAAGIVWLVETITTVRVDWGIVAAGALVLVGALVMITSGAARGGLITLGVLLAVGLLMSGTAGMHMGDMRFRGGLPGSGFGDRTERPRAANALQPSYSHAFGSMTLDLRGIDLPAGTTRVDASTSFGSTQVFLPADVPVRVVASTSFGSIELLGEELGGFGERTVQTEGYETAARRIDLTVSTAFGSAEVRR